MIWINKETTLAGIELLAAYAPKRDEARNIDLGPDHNWASHDADSWGLIFVAYEEPGEKKRVEVNGTAALCSAAGLGWDGRPRFVKGQLIITEDGYRRYLADVSKAIAALGAT